MNESECMEYFLWTAIMCCFRCVHTTAQEILHARRAIHALQLTVEDRTVFHYHLSRTEPKKSQINFSQLSSDSKENQNTPKQVLFRYALNAKCPSRALISPHQLHIWSPQKCVIKTTKKWTFLLGRIKCITNWRNKVYLLQIWTGFKRQCETSLTRL